MAAPSGAVASGETLEPRRTRGIAADQIVLAPPAVVDEQRVVPAQHRERHARRDERPRREPRRRREAPELVPQVADDEARRRRLRDERRDGVHRIRRRRTAVGAARPTIDVDRELRRRRTPDQRDGSFGIRHVDQTRARPSRECAEHVDGLPPERQRHDAHRKVGDRRGRSPAGQGSRTLG